MFRIVMADGIDGIDLVLIIEIRIERVHHHHEFVGGRAAVPTAPGLGFEIDLEAVEQARERYERQGPY